MTTSKAAGNVAKLRDQINVRDPAYGAKGDGVTDDTVAIQAALTYAAQNNAKVYFPRGVYLVSTGLTMNGVSASTYGRIVRLEGDGSHSDDTVAGTVLKWNGTSDVANTLFKANGIYKLICKGIAFQGNGKVGKAFWATQNVGTSYAPFGWRFEDCTFESVLAGGYGFYIDTTTNMARFNFVGCRFGTGSASTGFYTANQNSLNHSFVNCAFDSNDYGLNVGGSFCAIGCEFSLNALADVYIQICDSITMIDCWTEQSRQFIKSDTRTDTAPLTLIGCRSSSFPWAYWKLDETNRPQPTNDTTQWVHVLWDGDRGALNLIGCRFSEPFNFAVTGAVAPTSASLMRVQSPNGTNTSPPRFNFMGSLAQSGAGDTWTDQFFYYGTQLAAPRIAPKKSVQSFGNLSGAIAATPHLYSTAQWTMTGNNTVTIATTLVSAGDRVAFDVTQNGVGGWTMAFVNAKTAGVFTPTAAAGARSRIEFEFDGTSWIEASRALNLA